MAQLGKLGIELLDEVVKREDRSLPPYNEELVRQVIAECSEHAQRTDEIVSTVKQRASESTSQAGDRIDWTQYPQQSTSLLIHHEAIKRNKRLLVAYYKQRMLRLEEVRWTHRQLPDEVRECCCAAELQYYREYDRILNTLTGFGDDGFGLDLTTGVVPTKDPMIAVRVAKQHGEAMFTTGAQVLNYGQVLMLPRKEAEPFLREGVLELMDKDDL